MLSWRRWGCFRIVEITINIQIDNVRHLDFFHSTLSPLLWLIGQTQTLLFSCRNRTCSKIWSCDVWFQRVITQATRCELYHTTDCRFLCRCKASCGVCDLQGQGGSAGSDLQKLNVFSVSPELFNLLQPNLVYWCIITSQSVMLCDKPCCFFPRFFLCSSIGGVVYVAVFKYSSTAWAATFRLRGYKYLHIIFVFP